MLYRERFILNSVQTTPFVGNLLQTMTNFETEYENGIITMPECNTERLQKGIGYQYFTSMTKNRDKVFQIDAFTGKEETFGTVLQRCVRTALKMQSLGVERGDLITLCSLNNMNSCVPYIATFLIGAIPANLDPLIAPSDLKHLLNMFDPKMIFVEENFVEQVEMLLETTGKTSVIVVFGHSDKHLEFSEFLQPSLSEEVFLPVDVDLRKTAIVLFSSGSTGLPKGVCLSHLAHLRQVSIQLEMETSYDKMLTFSRLYWATAVLFMGVSILSGSSRIIIPKFHADLTWNVIQRLKPRYMFASPYQLATLCARSDASEINVSCLEIVYVGGGMVFEHQTAFYQKFFVNAVVKLLYGSTESGIITYSSTKTKEQLDLLKTKPQTIGSTIKGFKYKVVDLDSRQVLGAYRNGELLVKTENIMNGYYKLDSSDAWECDGWFRTGDIVYYDEDFYFYYVDRLKEVIKYQTMHVVPKFIESLLFTHPKVKNVCVVSVLHEVDGEHPVAVVQLQESCETVCIERDLYDFVAQNLEDKYKLRGGVQIVEELPMTPTGKINIRALRDLVRNKM